MKPRLIILSDLWGVEKSEWIKYYIENLNLKFEIQFYDCCDLGKVNKSDYVEEILHKQFVNNGIEIAMERLLELEKETIDVLAFSIGGTIAWKAQLKGLKINNFYAISSTRLRYETSKPNCHTRFFFGEKDEYLPSSDWFNNIGIEPYIFTGKGHKLYSKIDCINEICNEIKTTYNAA